jgi:hypothetical protein
MATHLYVTGQFPWPVSVFGCFFMLFLILGALRRKIENLVRTHNRLVPLD